MKAKLGRAVSSEPTFNTCATRFLTTAIASIRRFVLRQHDAARLGGFQGVVLCSRQRSWRAGVLSSPWPRRVFGLSVSSVEAARATGSQSRLGIASVATVRIFPRNSSLRFVVSSSADRVQLSNGTGLNGPVRRHVYRFAWNGLCHTFI